VYSRAFLRIPGPKVVAFPTLALLVAPAASAFITFMLAPMIFADHRAGALVVRVIPTLVVVMKTRGREAYALVGMDPIAPFGTAFLRMSFAPMMTTPMVVLFAGLALRVLAQPRFALIPVAAPTLPSIWQALLRDANGIRMSNVPAPAGSALRMRVRPAPMLVLKAILWNTDRAP